MREEDGERTRGLFAVRRAGRRADSHQEHSGGSKSGNADSPLAWHVGGPRKSGSGVTRLTTRILDVRSIARTRTQASRPEDSYSALAAAILSSSDFFIDSNSGVPVGLSFQSMNVCWRSMKNLRVSSFSANLYSVRSAFSTTSNMIF